ncbi:MAG: LamG-like jellyroll fold domain-containing protein [Planctomycetota bacterium]
MANSPARVFTTALFGVVTAMASAPAQGPVPAPPNLLAWWAMDGSADDLGDLALHGALAQTGGSFPPGMVLAGFRPALPDGHLEVPDAPELHLRSDFTFEMWVRVDALATGPTWLVNKGTADLRGTPFALGVIGSDGALSADTIVGIRSPGRPFVSVSDGVQSRVAVANQVLTMGAWAHLAFTVTDSQLALYVNGARRGLSSGTRLPFAGLQSLRLGGVVGGSAVNGVLDEVSCYTRALSATEIQAIVVAGPQGKVKPNRDRTPPVVTISAPLAGAVVGARDLVVQASVVDDSATVVTSVPAGVAASLPAGGGPVSGAVSLPGPDGAQVIAVAATDAGGSSSAASVTVTLDTTPPAVAVVTPAEGAVLGTATATFAITVDDLTGTTLDVDGRQLMLPPGQNATLFDVALNEGPNAVTVTVTDAAGHRTVLVRRVTLDLSVPIVAIASPPDGALFGAGAADVAVTVRVDDLTATTVTSTPGGVAGALPAGGGLLSGLVPLTEGLNRIAVRAADELGNEGEAIVTVNLDRTAPDVTFASPDTGGALRGVVGVEVTAADIAPGSGVERIDLFAGDALLASVAGAVCRFDLDTATLADGDLLLRAVAVDGAGNAGSAAMLLRIDNTPPAVRILEPLAGTVSGTVAFVAVATDAGAGVVGIVQRVGGRAPTGDGSAAFEPALGSAQATGSEDTQQWPNGPVRFEVEATDAAGNVTVALVEVDVQNAQGEGPGLSPRDGARVSGTVRLQVRTDARDVLELELQVDGQRVAVGHGRRLRVSFDTTTRMDGPMVVRALLRTAAGTAETVHTLRVENLRLQALSPHVLSLGNHGCGDVRAIVSGPAAALARLVEQPLLLRVPGGAAVPMRSFEVLGGGRGHGRCGEPRVALVFDRAELVAALQAAQATGAIAPDARRVRVQLCAGELVIGREHLWICRGGRGGSRR